MGVWWCFHSVSLFDAFWFGPDSVVHGSFLAEMNLKPWWPEKYQDQIRGTVDFSQWCWTMVSLNVCKMPDSRKIALATTTELQHIIRVPQFTIGCLGSIHINTLRLNSGLNSEPQSIPYLALKKSRQLQPGVEEFSWRHMLSGLGISLICAFWWWAHRCHLTFFKPQTEKGNGWKWMVVSSLQQQVHQRLPLIASLRICAAKSENKEV